MIVARRLTKEYGSFRAVDGLSFTVSAGELFGILGPNGAGKTTTIRLFLGFIAPTSGMALIDGLDVQTAPQETKRRLAYIPEQVALYPNLTGLENLAYFVHLARGESLPDERLKDVLRRAGLPARAFNERVSTYSKGMRQKVGIAIALAKEAKALLLDEPTSGLDPSAAYDFMELLRSLSDEGTAILMATHDIFRAREACDRVGMMRRGQLVEVLERSDLEQADLQQLYLEHMQGARDPNLVSTTA